ncbi:hypothetical protein DFS34DRAFT_457292 [Phlyctochytrium arcticum]|nr:hypothetical protein DFS34DRAFT_457292 [Phlyctochytrium arcticum]
MSSSGGGGERDRSARSSSSNSLYPSPSGRFVNARPAVTFAPSNSALDNSSRFSGLSNATPPSPADYRFQLTSVPAGSPLAAQDYPNSPPYPPPSSHMYSPVSNNHPPPRHDGNNYADFPPAAPSSYYPPNNQPYNNHPYQPEYASMAPIRSIYPPPPPPPPPFVSGRSSSTQKDSPSRSYSVQSSAQQSTRGLVDGSKASIFEKWTNLSWARVALGLSIIQCLVICVLEVVVIVMVNTFLDDAYDDKKTLPIVNVYFSLFILALVYQAAWTYDATIHKNTMQTIAVVVFNIASLGYSIIQTNQISDLRSCSVKWVSFWNNNINGNGPIESTMRFYDSFTSKQNAPGCIGLPFGMKAYGSTERTDVWSETLQKWISVPVVLNMRDGVVHVQAALDRLRPLEPVTHAIIALMVVVVFVSAFVAWKVYQEYGWKIFQEQGASIQKKRILRRVHLFILLLKVNVYFAIGIVAQIVTATIYSHRSMSTCEDPNTPENSQNCFSPVESKSRFMVYPSMIIFGIAALSFYFLGWYAIKNAHRPTMYTFFGVYVANIAALVSVIAIFSTDDTTQSTRKWLLTFSIIQLLLNLGTLAIGFVCLKDFDKGVGQIALTKKDMEAAAAKVRPRLELD